MQFITYTEAELQQLRCSLTEGIADFEVMSAEEATSKNNNAMIKLRVKVWDQAGHSQVLTDYLVALDAMAFKIRHFWEAVNNLAKYESGNTPAMDYVNKKGQCRLKWQVSKNKDYPDRMVIDDYIMDDPAATALNDDSDIPF